jgi:transposase InsO family protein
VSKIRGQAPYSETGPPGSEGGHAEKDQPRLAPRCVADPTRTVQTEWAYRRIYTSNTRRANALPRWLQEYNHHRPHTALAGQPPISRVSPRS